MTALVYHNDFLFVGYTDLHVLYYIVYVLYMLMYMYSVHCTCTTYKIVLHLAFCLL